ncbi:MAG TPA: hypothetical protein VEB43_08780 [Anaeromyxobacter sp.]|nr:hypothetical protein [Anaeromyxobacter sp.]
MDETLNAARVIHYYDTRTRETLCGLRGFEERSTKHARGVTCRACAGLLHQRLTPAPSPGGSAASA